MSSASLTPQSTRAIAGDGRYPGLLISTLT